MARLFYFITMGRLDSRSKFPSGMEDYLEMYGWHFNKKMYEWAVGNEVITKEQFDELCKKHNVTIENKVGYDRYYIANLLKNKFKAAFDSDLAMLRFIREYLKQYEDIAFTHFYAGCIANGTPIIWEDML